MSKGKLQSTLIGLSVTTATMNVVSLVLSQVNLPGITTGFFAPLLVIFGFFQSVIVVTNHLRQ